MNRTIEQRKTVVEEIVADNHNISPVTASMAGFRLQADSLNLLELQMDVEDEFGVEIPDTEAQQWRTVQDIMDSITRAELDDIGA